MIRYPVPPKVLLRRIRQEIPDWLRRAYARTEDFSANGGYYESADSEPFWEELLPIYLSLQENKCIYCERTLDDVVYGHVEMNVEHYRPKANVNAWPSRYMQKTYPHLQPYPRLRGSALPGGYWSLAYHPLNLAVSCLRCNLRVKLQFFPIDGTRVPPTSGGMDLRNYQVEQPDLFYPLSTIDPGDSEACITFRGPVAFPSSNVTVRLRERARVTIDLLHLNQRSELIRGRCRAICMVFAGFLLTGDQDPVKRDVGVKTLQAATVSRAPHSHCARCFLELCRIDHETAHMYYQEAVKRIT